MECKIQLICEKGACSNMGDAFHDFLCEIISAI